MNIIESVKEKLEAVWKNTGHPSVKAAREELESVEESPALHSLNDHLDKILSEGNRPLDSQHASDLVHLTAAASAATPPAAETQHSLSPKSEYRTDGTSPSGPDLSKPAG